MKKLVVALSTLCIAYLGQSQDLVSKIPSNATAVVAIKGKRMLDLVSVSEFSNSRLGQMLGKELGRETDGQVNNLEQLGLDLNNNFYYFLEAKEGVFNNCFLIPLKNSNGVLSLLGERQKEDMVTEGSISYIQDDYDGSVILWNENAMLVLISESTKNDYSYYDDYGYDVPLATEEMAITVEEGVSEGAEEVEIAAEAVEDAKESVESAAEEVIEETIIDIEETVIESVEPATPDYDDYYNSEAYKKEQEEREKKRLAREAKRKKEREAQANRTLDKAKAIMAGNHTNGNILKNTAYVQSIGNGQDEAVAWVNDFGRIYQDMVMGAYYGGMVNPYDFMGIDKLYNGFSITARLNFEKDHASLKTKYQMNRELADIYKPMYSGKFNPNFTKYINEDRLLGYWSLNMSTEGLLTAYPQLMDMVFNNSKGENYADAVSLGTDLFSTLIDEEAAGEIIRGDMLLVLNDLSEREVTYTDYEYDEEYNYKEVEKTKTETVPDFMFMFSSEKKGIFDRLVRIGIRENELKAIGGIYQITDMPNASPFDLYVMFKDNTVFMGSSKKDMLAIGNGTFVSKLSGTHKKNMKKNVTSMFVNGKKIISEIPAESFPRELRDKVAFLTANTEDVYFNFEKIKGTSMEGEMIWNTPEEGHNNSFAYFINMIDSLMD